MSPVAAAARAAPAPITISGPSTSAGPRVHREQAGQLRGEDPRQRQRRRLPIVARRQLDRHHPDTPPAVTIGTTRAPGASLVPRTERASPRVNAVATGVSLDSGIVPIRPIVVDA